MNKQAQTEPRSEADTFTELTRKLLAVPKKEVDKEKAKYEKKKARENEKRAK
ncbi:MAG TPA: hypothetical protein VGB73_04710 [Pyrinomonadaceae bacterium]|jgi:hypothetical protein